MNTVLDEQKFEGYNIIQEGSHVADYGGFVSAGFNVIRADGTYVGKKRRESDAKLLVYADLIAQKITAEMGEKFPYFFCEARQMLGQVVSISVSLEPAENWPNKYIENSHYQKLLVHVEPRLEMSKCGGNHSAKLRTKRNVPLQDWEKMAKHVINQLQKILDSQ